MTGQKRSSAHASILWNSLLGAICGVAEELKPLTVDEAKFQMAKLYSEAKLPLTSLRTKYPALRKADKLARDARQDYSKAIINHPKLKADFDKIGQLKTSIPEKLKLQKPLFAKAETLTSLDKTRTKYNQARVLALKEEISALRSEGHQELADGLAALLRRVKR